LPTPDEWRSEVDQALFGADDDAPRRSEQPGSFDFPLAPEGESEHVVDADTLDAALFGAREASAVTVPAPLPEPVAPSPVPDSGHEIYAGEESFAEDRTFAGDEHETIVAETADAEDLVEPTGPERGRRRAWMLAGFTALLVVIGGTAGALIAGRSDDSRQKGTTVSARTTVATTTAPTTLPVPTTTAPTTLPVPGTTAPPVTSAPRPAPTAPRTPATSRRTVPPPREPVVEPAPAPSPPPPTEPPPTSPPTAPPSTSVLLP
jgi:hypothetical protein